MDASLTEIAGAVVAVGGVLGATGKYLLDRVSKRQTDLETRQENERTRLEAERVRHEIKVETERLRWEKVMQEQIAEMRREIRLQDHEIGFLRQISDAYLRHILALEQLMRAAGIQIPELVLPRYAAPPMDDEETVEDEDRRRRRRRGEAC